MMTHRLTVTDNHIHICNTNTTVFDIELRTIQHWLQDFVIMAIYNIIQYLQFRKLA